MVTTRKNKCNGILSTRILKIKQMKQEVLVKLAGSTVYNKRINIDPNNLTNILKFPKEVFADIDGIRIAINSLTGDLKSDLATIGKEISKAASSTFGTLFATCFIRASAAAASDADDLTNLQKCLSAAFDGVSARGKAQLGERTLLDALHPAVEAVKNATDIKSGLAQAAIAARAGATATALMMPKHGRAGWIGERAKGLEDAGASVIAVVFESIK
jgi:dihydroxyacetone kinase-like protein